MKNLKDRLLLLINEFGLTKAEFEQEVGLSNGFVDKSGDNTRQSSLNRISNRYPNVNIAWLRTGEGEMIKSAPTPQLSEEREFAGVGYLHLVPKLPVSAQGGSFNDFVASIKENDCEMIISPVKAADFAITISGDSMAPEYPSGCQILIKKINEKAFIEWGKVYVLDTCNGTVIKEVHKGEASDEIECHSINPDPKYQPFPIRLSDIYGIYRVIMCMSLK